MLSGLLDALFPARCVACAAFCDDAAAGPFCPDCAALTEPSPSPRCRTCGEPGRFPHGRCGRCLAHAPPFARVFAPFVHEGPVARAIHRFKYEDHPELARPLGELLFAHSADFLASGPRELVAVPLHPTRRRQRGYDQALLLAQELSRRSGLGLLREALRRTRATVRQVGTSEHQRSENVSGAFEAASWVEGRAFVLLDDVLTTGATAAAATRALLARGAGSVHLLTLARAPRHG